jgi:hypothetical protein
MSALHLLGAVAPVAAPAAAGSNILGTIGRHILQGLQDNSNALIAGGGAMMSGGLGKGFSAMAAAAPLDIAARRERQGNEAVAATYQAVLQQQLSRGVPPVEARANALAASQNKEILTTLMGPQFQHVEIKGLGGDTTIGAFDPRTGTVTVGGKPLAGAGGTSGEVPSGQEYLDKYVPKELHNSVRAMANYDLPTGGFGALKQLQPHVANYDPTFDAASYPTKVALKKAYQGGGKNFQELQALETVSHHMGKLVESAKALDPSDWKVVNNIRNIMSDNPVIGRDNPALVRFRNDLNTVQHELGNAYHAGHITDTSLKAFQQAIADNMSTPGLKAAIGEMGGLLEGKIRANANSFTSSFPGRALPGEFKGLSDKAAEAFTRINDWANNIPRSTRARHLARRRERSPRRNTTSSRKAHLTAPDGSQRPNNNGRLVGERSVKLESGGEWWSADPCRRAGHTVSPVMSAGLVGMLSIFPSLVPRRAPSSPGSKQQWARLPRCRRRRFATLSALYETLSQPLEEYRSGASCRGWDS